MKKIITIILMILPISVFAMDSSLLNISDKEYFLCSNSNEAFTLKEAWYDGNIIVPIRRKTDHNYNYSNYVYTLYGYKPFNEYYYGVYDIINNITNNYTYQYLIKYAWEKQFGQAINFCNEDSSIIDSKNIEYESVKNEVDNIINGTYLKDTYFQEPNKKYVYINDYYKYYDILNTNNTDVNLDDNKLSITINEDTFITLKLKGNKKPGQMYTDNTNYIAVGPNLPDNIYTLNFNVGSSDHQVNIINNYNNVCFNIYYDNNSDTFCDNDVTYKLNNDKYKIVMVENDMYEPYTYEGNNSVLNIKLKEKKGRIENVPLVNDEKAIEYVKINKDEIIDDVIMFVPEDTYAY